jgi:plastocyanin
MTHLYDISRAKRMGLRLRLALSGFAATALLACGGSNSTTSPVTPTPPGPPMTAATIDATPAISFSPSQVRLVQGGTVTFAFGTVAHNVFFDDDPPSAPADIPGVNSNASVSRVFTTAGVYAFNCHIHPGMQGTVTVVAPDTP